jgi:hypothetical protein
MSQLPYQLETVGKMTRSLSVFTTQVSPQVGIRQSFSLREKCAKTYTWKRIKYCSGNSEMGSRAAAEVINWLLPKVASFLSCRHIPPPEP